MVTMNGAGNAIMKWEITFEEIHKKWGLFAFAIFNYFTGYTAI